MAMEMFGDIPIWGELEDEQALTQIETCAKSAVRAALMADHHVGYSVPIGGVVAYADAISPSGVGFDIACGNKAVLTDALADDVRRDIAKIMTDIYRTLSFGAGLKNSEKVDHELFDDEAWRLAPSRQLKDKARSQLGTIGSGNHYVDLFVDELDRVWIGVHFGSRGYGHGVATHFIDAGGGQDGMFVEPVVFSIHANLGADYLAQMTLAGRYAYAGRDWVCNRVAKLMGARILEEVHNQHNFAWLESHDGMDLWVVRKGATPAFPGQRGFVGGSMGDISVILEGVESADGPLSLYSTVHGAGRVMSRTKAAGRRVRGKRMGGLVTSDMMHDWVKREGVELRGAGTDESPHCYKRLPEVLAHHQESIKIVHTLRPIGVAMAGADEFDPYKD